MHRSDFPFVLDWFVISLRWLIVLGLTISLSLGGELVTAPGLVLLGLVAWNLALTVLAILNRRLPYHRQISLGIDFAAAITFFILQEGFFGPASWVVILPLLSAALYFEMRGVLVSAGIVSILQFFVTWTQSQNPDTLLLAGGTVLLTILLAVLFGFLGERVVASRIRQQWELQERLRVENERLRAIYNLTATLSATLNYQRVIDSALDISMNAMNSDPQAKWDDRLASAVLLFTKENVLEIAAARRLTSADLRATLSGREGAVASCIEEDKPILVLDVKNDPELRRIVALLNCSQVYCFPLRSGFNAYGILLFGHPERDYFGKDRRDVLDIIGRQAVIAIQNARLYQDLVDERDRMIEVQEEARNKLARDLHDGPTQSIAALTMRVGLTRRMIEKDPQSACEELSRIEELARRTSKEIRHMLFTLRPLILESQGLVAALHSMSEKTKEVFSQDLVIEVDQEVVKDLEMGKQGVIFFLVEEAVNNARKHAQAAHIWVRLRNLGEEIAFLEIQDDGIGFNVESVDRAYDKRGSLGLINLRERTELVNGILNIESAPGKGTKVQVYMPLTEAAADRLHRTASKN